MTGLSLAAIILFAFVIGAVLYRRKSPKSSAPNSGGGITEGSSGPRAEE